MKAPFCAVRASFERFSLSFSCPRVCGHSHYTDQGKTRKASRFLEADAVPSVFFFFAPASLRAPVSNGMSVDYEAEKGTALRESVQLTPVGQLMKPQSVESWRNARDCSASEVNFAGEGFDADRAANTRCRPTRRVHSSRLQSSAAAYSSCRKSKAILVGLRSCR